MTKFIVLSSAEAWSLFNNEPVEVYIDQIPHVICTDECYEEIRDEITDRMNEQEQSNYIKDMDVSNNRLKNLSERVENIEKQIKEDKEEKLKKLKAELDHAKFCCAL